ncbi:MAG: glycosyltransferase [Candidatus Sumerlaeia bacterium]|nr:glycosyltransferase [Candidatus Sumerlaeia bacterium]
MSLRPLKILAFSPGLWGWPEFAGSPRYHLWSLAGRGHRVVYVEPPIMLRAKAAVWKAADRDFTVFGAPWVPPFAVRKAPPTDTGDWWRRKTSELLWKRTKKFIDGMKYQPEVLWFGAPWHSHLNRCVREVGAPMRVAHIYDELSLSPALAEPQREALWSWERELLRMMDLALCSSEPQLQRRYSLARKSMLLENAVADFFIADKRVSPTKEAVPFIRRMDSIEAPRIVYGGVLDARVNPEVLEMISSSFAANLVVAGKIDPAYPAHSLQKLKANPAVHFLGSVPYSAFPHLYDRAEVLLLAHHRSPFTDGMYPEKMNEYLASGKPVVATRIPEAGRIARDIGRDGAVLLAETPAQFSAMLQRALKEAPGGPLAAARQKYARTHTWSATAERLDRELHMQLDHRPIF